jgi:polysaccharide biosynthesis/export protein
MEQIMKKIIFVLTMIFLRTLPGKSLAQEKQLLKNNPAALGEETLASYIIGSGDVLEILTWNEPELSRGEVLVRPDGKISFPFLDDLQAAGLTPFELKQKIEDGLKKYVEHPHVMVDVKNADSKKFYILGEVVNTGEYPLSKKLTVLQAFTIAGGFTEWASKREIILLRNEGGKENIYRINYKRIIDGKDLSQNLELRPNDTIIVP